MKNEIIICFIDCVVNGWAILLRMPSFSDIKYPQRCENLCEVLKQRLIGVSDKEKQERLLRDYDECKASYDEAINSNSQNSWCVHIYTSPYRGACRIKCGSAMCSRRRIRHAVLNAKNGKKRLGIHICTNIF